VRRVITQLTGTVSFILDRSKNGCVCGGRAQDRRGCTVYVAIWDVPPYSRSFVATPTSTKGVANYPPTHVVPQLS